jgi:predicted permease
MVSIALGIGANTTIFSMVSRFVLRPAPVVYTALLCVISGLLLGLAPSWAATRPRMAGALKGDVAFARGHFFSARNLLVMAQVAMALILLSMTGLFLRSLRHAAQIDIGFKTHGLLLLSVDPRLNGYSPEQTSAYLATLRQTVAALPGVQDVVSTDVAMLSGGNRSDGFNITGRSNKGDAYVMSDLYMVTPRFFQALGVPLLRGEDFGHVTATDRRVAVVNQAFAQKLFGSADPIGQHIDGGKWHYEIIGVVGNAKSRTLGEDTRAILYRSLDQSIAEDPSMMGYTLIVRTPGDAAELADTVRSKVQQIDPAVAIYNMETMDQHVRAAYVLPRLAASLFGVFGGIGLLLATVGLYGVMSFAVTRSLKEISIRMAVGAEPSAVLRLVMRWYRPDGSGAGHWLAGSLAAGENGRVVPVRNRRSRRPDFHPRPAGLTSGFLSGQLDSSTPRRLNRPDRSPADGMRPAARVQGGHSNGQPRNCSP